MDSQARSGSGCCSVSKILAFSDFGGGFHVGQRAARRRIVGHDCLLVTRSLRDADRPGYHGTQYLIGEVLAHLRSNLGGEVGAAVVHGQQNGGDDEVGVQVLLDHLDVLEQLAQAFKCVVLALDGNEYLAGRAECVDREQAETRRAVDEDEVESPLTAFFSRSLA